MQGDADEAHARLVAEGADLRASMEAAAATIRAIAAAAPPPANASNPSPSPTVRIPSVALRLLKACVQLSSDHRCLH